MRGRQFTAALSRHPVASHAVGETAGAVIEGLDAEDPDLVVCFASPHFVGAFDDMVYALHNLLDPGVLVGMTVAAAIGIGQEVEEGPAFSVFAARLPGGRPTPVRLDSAGAATAGDLADLAELRGRDRDPACLLLLADPFSFAVAEALAGAREHHPELVVIGGLASAARGPGGNRLALGAEVHERGAVGVLLAGSDVRTVVSQGCRPVGRPFVVTRSDGDRVEELAGRPALERLGELAEGAPDDERALLREGLHLGIVVDEHRLDFGPGDFLVRNVLGASAETGAISVDEPVAVGQTVQFHVRDARAADAELRALLANDTARGGLLFTCNGRGRQMFDEADHDAGVVAELLGPIPLAGGFCAGEIGPVGERSHLHGFTASLLLFD